MGRPSKLTEETRARFIKGLKLGLTYELAASYAGVDVRTVYGWLQRGKQETDTIYSQLVHAVKESEGTCAAACMARIQKAAEGGQWQAAGWIMERRFGYSQRQEVRVDTSEDALDGVEDLIARVAAAAGAIKGEGPDEDDD